MDEEIYGVVDPICLSELFPFEQSDILISGSGGTEVTAEEIGVDSITHGLGPQAKGMCYMYLCTPQVGPRSVSTSVSE